MKPNISAKNLFADGADVRFWQTVKSVNLAEVEFLTTPSIIRADHSNGAPNSSYPSTLDGSISSARAIVNGLQINTKRSRLFGNTIFESIDTVRNFYNEFLKK